MAKAMLPLSSRLLSQWVPSQPQPLPAWFHVYTRSVLVGVLGRPTRSLLLLSVLARSPVPEPQQLRRLRLWLILLAQGPAGHSLPHKLQLKALMCDRFYILTARRML